LKNQGQKHGFAKYSYRTYESGSANSSYSVRMMDIRIISGTDRPKSNALKVAKYLKPRYEEQGAAVDLVDLQRFPIRDVQGGKYGKDIPKVNKFVKPIVSADGLVFVVPEYNGGYPGILKLMIDYLPFPNALEKMPVCLLGESAGAFGALRAVEQLQLVLGYRNAYLFPERVFISRVNKNFDPQKGVRDEMQRELLTSQIHNFTQYVKNIRSHEPVSDSLTIE